MVRVVWLVWSLFWGALAAHAASIEFLPAKPGGISIVSVIGELLPGDDEKFERIVFNLESAIVWLDSPGGEISSGLAIAKQIKFKSFDTVAAPNSICSSMCGVVWLSGKQRFAYPSSKIGFHAAYRGSDGTESGKATAQIGVYLYQLGYSQTTIDLLTSSKPNDMLWLSESLAQSFGIEFSFLQEPSQAQPAPTPLRTVPSTAGFDILKDRDIFGFDMGEAVKVSSRSECELQCSYMSNCNAFTFNKVNSLCYKKSGGREVMWNQNAESGFVSKLRVDLQFLKIVIISGTKLEGTTYSTRTGLSLERCAVICNEEAQCTGFEFEHRPSASCRLKSGNLKRVKKPRQTAGVKTLE